MSQAARSSLPFTVDIPRASLFAKSAGVTRDAAALVRESTVLDLHVDSYLGSRLWRYDLLKRNGKGPFDGTLFGQLDFPRALRAGVSAATWSIVPNPLRRPKGRLARTLDALKAIEQSVQSTDGRMVLARTHQDFCQARAKGAHAAFVAVQGGNAFDAMELDQLGKLPIHRVTVIHLTNSSLGGTSSPLGFMRPNAGLSARGKNFVEALNHMRIVTDLAHASRQSFADILEVHNHSMPPIVSHTGLYGVTPHWRNLTDDQVRQVANRGGVIGIMFQRSFLTRKNGPSDGRMVVEHLKHLIDVGGEDCAAIGSDYDGAIVPPSDMKSGEDGYVRLVQHMMNEGMSEPLIRKVLGENAIRVIRDADRA